MTIAITLTAAPRSQEPLLDLAAKLQRELNGEFKFAWLSEGEAVDLILPGEPLASQAARADEEGAGCDCFESLSSAPADQGELKHLRRIVAEAAAHYPIDWCVQPTRGRRKRMLIADMDSTIIGQESIDEMADLKGIRPKIAALTGRAMRGELDFETSLRERMRLLAGETEADLKRVLDERLTLNPGARELVQTMKAHGAHTVLVSGGFTFFTGAVAERAGFAVNRGNELLWEDGRICGAAEPILGPEAKLDALTEEAAAHRISPPDVLAVGDGANDLAMLGAAGLGVAYRAKPVVAAQAAAQVRYGDLTALLYFQGYRRACFSD